MPKRGQRQPYRVTYTYAGKPCRSATPYVDVAHDRARTAAHARRHETGEDRTSRVLHIADDGTETVIATYEGDQFTDDDEDE